MPILSIQALNYLPNYGIFLEKTNVLSSSIFEIEHSTVQHFGLMYLGDQEKKGNAENYVAKMY